MCVNLLAFTDDLGIVSAVLVFTGDTILVVSAGTGTTAAVISLEGQQSDLPDNINPFAKILERYGVLQAAVAGNAAPLTAAVMAQSADPPAQSLLAAALSTKANNTMSGVRQAHDLIDSYIRGRAGQSVNTVVNRSFK
ncbi:MAG: hypothetical protein WDW38_003864 [Sanguina aurantia]